MLCRKIRSGLQSDEQCGSHSTRSSSFKEEDVACRPVFILDADRGLRSDRWYAKRAGDHQISAHKEAALFPFGVCELIPCTKRRADFEEKIATVLKTAKGIGAEIHKGMISTKEEDYTEMAGAYGWTNILLFTIVALRTESHLKSTQFFEDSLTRNRSEPCATPFPWCFIVDSQLFARASQRF